MRLLVLLGLLAAASPSAAQEWEWELIPGTTSAQLAATGWQLVGTSSFAITTTVGIVTYWSGELEGKPIVLSCLDMAASNPPMHHCSQPAMVDQ
jgi:hypothetical protein